MKNYDERFEDAIDQQLNEQIAGYDAYLQRREARRIAEQTGFERYCEKLKMFFKRMQCKIEDRFRTYVL